MDDFVETRQAIFNKINSPVIEAPEIQLARAVTFAEREGRIKWPFFRFDDKEATSFLLKRCNGQTKTLVERVLSDQHYVQVDNRRFSRPSEEQSELLSSFEWRQATADRLATELRIPPEDVAVNSGKFKGYVDLSSIDIKDHEGRDIVLPKREPYMFAHTYVHPAHVDKQDRLAEIMDELLLLKSPS